MSLFDIFKKPNINEGVEQYKNTKGAVLLDVRTKGEYAEGHIPQSRNLDLARIAEAERIWKNKDVQFFVYCYSGARSTRAVNALKAMGYMKVTNIGGIAGYQGKIER